MLEIEAKYRLHDPPELERKLLALGARLIADQIEEDHYWNAPDRDFARTDEALRLRRIGERNWLTYKGPRIDQQSKSRQELEVPCPEGAEAATAFGELLACLGYRSTATVRKHRRLYESIRNGFPMHVCVDDVNQVGSFVELEIVAPPSDLEAARSAIFGMAEELGLTEPEPRSYLEQLLGRAVPPGGSRTVEEHTHATQDR